MNLDKFKLTLNNLETNHLLRITPNIKFQSPSRGIIDGENFLIMNSNNYLGLTYHTKVISAGIEALKSYGSGSTGSRLTTGSFSLFKNLEKDLAQFKHSEAALIFNTGFTANLAIISTLTTKGDYIFSDELNHASIIDGCKYSKATKFIYPHKDTTFLENLLKKLPYSSTKLIVTDGVFSMDGDIAPLDKLVFLAEKYNCLLMLDDAHGTGVLGKGFGTAAHFQLNEQIHLQVGTLSKALGSVGGFVATNQIIKDYLINKARPFIFSTAISPCDIATAHQALKLISKEPEHNQRLMNNIAYMKKALTKANIHCPTETAIFPLIVKDNAKALNIAQELYNNRILLSAIRPPTVPENEARLRLTVTASHTFTELQETVNILQKLWIKYNL